MNEESARRVLLVRAVETAEGGPALLSESDRGYASRAAAELAQWKAADRGNAASGEAYVVKRAELLHAKLRERDAALVRAAERFRWRGWLGWGLPLMALLAGLALEHVTDRKHVNLLAVPLLGLLAWNIVIYAFIVLRALTQPFRSNGAALDPIRRWLAGGTPKIATESVLARFRSAWYLAAAPLTGARIARVLHLAAALFAVGVLAGLYLRGLVFEFRAGWESTFLGPGHAHALLSWVLGPAAHLVGIPFPSVDEIARLRFSETQSGENAARWILFYGLTVILAVIVPRSVLAAWNALRASWLAKRFPVPLHELYFRRLLAASNASTHRLRATPYSYTLETAAIDGLRVMARHLYGERAEVELDAAIAFGAEDQVSTVAGEPLAARLAVFNLGATPEAENHGEFLNRMRTQGVTTVVIVDESAYRRRLGEQAGAEDRMKERRAVWESLVRAHGFEPIFVDLITPDLAAVERRWAALGGVKR
jgi:Protein of unknown function (DUF2868)